MLSPVVLIHTTLSFLATGLLYKLRKEDFSLEYFSKTTIWEMCVIKAILEWPSQHTRVSFHCHYSALILVSAITVHFVVHFTLYTVRMCCLQIV